MSSQIRKRAKKNCIYLHELVAQNIPNPDHLPYVEHINGNKLNITFMLYLLFLLFFKIQ